MGGENPVRVGVVGLGFFGAKHLAILADLEGVEVVAVCDADESRTAAARDRYGINRVFNDAHELASSADIDAIHVVTPEDQHASCVVPALQAGKHVLCEKPLSLDTDEIQLMEATAREGDAFLMPGHVLRFDPRYQQVRTLLDRGALGRVVYGNFRRFGNREIFPQVWSRAPGPYVASIHDVDLALWYFGDRPRRVVGMSTSAIDSQVPDSYAFLVEFYSGSVGVFETTCLPPAGSPFLTAGTGIYGTEGSVEVEHPSDALKIHVGRGPQRDDVFSWPETAAGVPGGALEREIRYFTDCVRTGTPPTAVTAADALGAVNLVRAALQATETGEAVILDDDR